MKIIIFLFFVYCMQSHISYAKNLFNFSNISLRGNETVVLVLVPGMNTDGVFFLKESPWTEFAKRNNLGVIALNYSSSVEDLLENRKGYFYPDQGSGQALLDEIKRVYGKDLPIILYGFCSEPL